ncbi:MAG: UDP-N-acetylmuramoyl-tripeptide--D-alanyl-D-alanine ligase [Nocardioidaceae bacterium]|nr:UDP-N-acetylmuramoyl-tripeptide--D-alanyl-D-alanine ligase [Nocardioidaceae bacterium]
MRLSEVAVVVGGQLHGPDVQITGPAYVDSRSPVAEGLFVAIAGEHVDGHDYAAGAHAVLGSRPTEAPTVTVHDPVAALGVLARHIIDRLDATVIAITGSQGKTGTKDYLAGVLGALAGQDAVVATTGNNNNELGVPLTVLQADSSTTHLVVEMGARGIGHIAYLCQIAPPRIAAVLNVGTAHVGEFGSKAAIAQAKGEIIEALPGDGIAVLNADDDVVAAMAPRTQATVVTFGQPAMVTWQHLETGPLGQPAFDLVHAHERHRVVLQQSGLHQLPNALAAAAAALGAGFGVAEVAAALSTVTATSRWRMEVTERSDGLVVINDAYNANPESMNAALVALSDIGSGLAADVARRTIAVLGPMYELGEQHDAGHRAVGHVAALHADVLVVVGTEARGIALGAHEHPRPRVDEVIHTLDKAEAVAWLRHNAGSGDVVLVKASRGAALEWIAERLLAEDGIADNEESTR